MAVSISGMKYKDINGDGKIDSNDQQVMGKYGWSATPFFYGVNITLNWKQFTLFIAGTGHMGAKAFKSNDWIYNQKKYTSVVRGRSHIFPLCHTRMSGRCSYGVSYPFPHN